MQCIPEELGKFAECHGVIRNHKNNPVIIWMPTPFLIFRELEMGKNFGLMAPLITSMGPDCVAISECGCRCKKWRVSKILALSPLT